MKKYYPKGDDGKTETKTVQSGIAPNQLIAKRYLTKFEIRKDAMINVHMAFDRERDLNVSLMSLPPEIIKNTDLLADLKLDLSAASKLNHNNIAQLYSIDTWNKIVFCVMEYVPGHTLAGHLEDQLGSTLIAHHGHGPSAPSIVPCHSHRHLTGAARHPTPPGPRGFRTHTQSLNV